MGAFTDKHKDSTRFEFKISVCTTGAWPTSAIHHVKYPTEITQEKDVFTRFYLRCFRGRRINFQADKGTATLSLCFNGKGSKIVTATAYQMLVLLCFNEKDKWSFKELERATANPKGDLELFLFC